MYIYIYNTPICYCTSPTVLKNNCLSLSRSKSYIRHCITIYIIYIYIYNIISYSYILLYTSPSVLKKYLCPSLSRSKSYIRHCITIIYIVVIFIIIIAFRSMFINFDFIKKIHNINNNYY